MTLYPYFGYKTNEFWCGGGGFRCDEWKCGITYRVQYPSKSTFNYTSDYKDGDVTWNIVNAKSLINVFGYDYFGSSLTVGAQITDFVLSSGGTTYNTSQLGVVQSIDPTAFQIIGGTMMDSGTFPPSGDPGLVLTGDQSKAKSCKINLTIQQGTVTSVTITDPGSGYSDGEYCTLEPIKVTLKDGSADTLLLDNFLVSVQDTLYIYQAYPMNEGAIIQPNTGLSSYTSYGFTLDSTKVNIKNGVLSLTDNPQNCITTGGSGYIIKDNLSINQLDIKLNSTIVSANAATITVKTTEDSGTLIRVPPLINPSVSIPDNFFTYNFYKQDPNAPDQPIYQNSPQQIGYIHPDLENDINTAITTGGPDQMKGYLFGELGGGFSDTVKLVTLQYTSLNYNVYYKDGSVPMTNIVGSDERLTVGKFIPYCRFSSALRNGANLNYSYDLYTTNDVRFIPNSITDIYTRKFTKTGRNSLPTF